MRNLKKLFAVLLTVAMIASMMVPALAAVNYEAEGIKLQSIGLIAGEEADLRLGESMTRLQGLAFTIRAAGKEDDAFAMTDAEVDAILADWKDADDTPSWNGNGRKYAAFAIKEEITLGISKVEKILAPNDPISGASFLVFLMKSAMGYEDVTTDFDSDDYVINVALNAGVLTNSQAVKYAMKLELIRDDAAGILYGAVMDGVNADGTKLIDALIASGDVDAQAAADAGFAAPPAPEALEVVSIEATNLKEFYINFNQDVEDLDAAKDEANYAVEGETVTGVEVSGSSVKVVTDDGIANQATLKVTVKAAILGKDTDFTKTFFDNTIPEVIGVSAITGPKSFKLKFSEPIESAGTITLKTGSSTLSVNAGGITGEGTDELTIPMYSAFVDGKSYTIAIKDFYDYAGYKTLDTTLTLDYVADTNPPVATIEKATQEKVVVKFSKPVSGLTLNNFYHTFSAYKPIKVTATDNISAGAINTNTVVETVYVWFYGDDGDPATIDRPIQEGTTFLRILGKDGDVEVKDAWGNKFESVSLTFSVTGDKTPPEVLELKAKEEEKLYIRFSEALKDFTADNVNILGSDGKAIDGLTVTIEDPVDITADYDYYIKLSENLAGKSITVTIKDVVDASINENEMADYTVALDIEDLTPPGITDVAFDVTGKALYVFYNEDVSATALVAGNYQLVKGDNFRKLAGKAEFFINNKIVKIALSDADVTFLGGLIPPVKVLVNDVEDDSGNAISATLTGEIVALSSIQPQMASAEATSTTTVVVTFDCELASVDQTAFEITGIDIIAMEVGLNGDGNTVVTLTLEDELDPKTEGVNIEYADATKIKDLFGVSPDDEETVEIDDKIAPALVDTDPITVSDATATIEIEFTEDLDDDLQALMMHDLVITKDGDALTAGIDYETELGGTDNILVITGVDVADLEDGTYKVASKASITYIRDTHGNIAKPFTTAVEVTIDND